MATVLNLESKPLLLAVTVLTSLDDTDLEELGFPEGIIRLDLVSRYAALAQDCGCDGVIASPLEVAAIRATCGPDFKIFTPGVRLPGSDKQDQKAVASPGKSIRDGANGVIIGRDITAAADPAAALELVVDDILAGTWKED
jgi:orotidine-5'-phosphate decarboxylase